MTIGNMTDQWSEWLLQQRYGGDPQVLQAMLPMLTQLRDTVLVHAQVQPGETLLDVGCGDGLIAFGALPLVGTTGKVIFSDISAALLQHCQQLAQHMGVSEQCTFVQASADNLSAIATSSVDVVTMRSVLLYVQDRMQALHEFYRVLKPGGRLSLFEPIHSFTYPEPSDRLRGYDVKPIMPIVQKLKAYYEQTNPAETQHMLRLNERELLANAEEVGFKELYADLQMAVIPESHKPTASSMSWQAFLQASVHPFAPPLAAVLPKVLTSVEIEQFTAYLRPLVATNQLVNRWAIAYVWAMK